nr:PREDICTED: uncharacterized protein LOC105671581 [Linepithema humile]
MPKISLRTLCLVTALLCNVQRSLEHEIPKRSFLSRRAIDGTRGRKLFDPSEDGAFDSYGSAGGYYDPYNHATDLSDIRKNVPGEPGVDYPAYVTLTQTGFTCEGRSRGYYADEAAGCQIFHVCHDVLVSSFLCPIGSIFSQKLLTCDWWNKVDCSSTKRYLEVNRGSYQVDDDEMIRNAYAMISLQSSAEDVTRDGLVDPDSGARIIDYSALGFRRISAPNYPDATENDLPSGVEDYSHINNQQTLNLHNYDPYLWKKAKYQDLPSRLEDYIHRNQQIVNQQNYDPYQRKKMSPASNQDKFQFANKERSPYHASAIIRHDNPTGNNEFQNTDRRPDGFTNSLHTSYAPTVPTVTTTTRRFYSPTVPTTYRPSTLAYSKLDLIVDSSDHLYAQSKTPVTPPTISHHNDDVRNIKLGESETKHGDLKKSESVSSPKTDKIDENDDDERSKSDKVHLNRGFRINVTDTIYEDEVFRQQNDRPVIKNDSKESAEDIEARDSIGITQALNNPLGRIVISDKYLLRDYTASTVKQQDAVYNDNQTTMDHNSSSSKSIINFKIFMDTSASSLKLNFEIPKPDLFLKPPVEDFPVISATSTTEKSIDTIQNERFSANDNETIANQHPWWRKSVFDFNDTSKIKDEFSEVTRYPAQFLKPPQEDSFINIPEEPRYTTVKPAISTTEKSIDNIHDEANRFSSNDNQTEVDTVQTRFFMLQQSLQQHTTTDANFETTWNPDTTTEFPQFHSTTTEDNQDVSLTTVNDNVDRRIPHIDLRLTRNLIFDDWYNDDPFVRELVPPTEQYDHTERAEAQKTQNSSEVPRKDDSEAVIQNQQNFTIKIQEEPKINIKFPCYNSRGELCETSSVAPDVALSTPSADEKLTQLPPNYFQPWNFSFITRLPEKSVTSVPNEFSIFTTQSPIITNSNVAAEESNLKIITPRSVLGIKDSEEKTENTTSDLHDSINVTPLRQLVKQIEEKVKNVMNDQQNFKILKSVEQEDEVTTVSQVPKLSDHVSSEKKNNFLSDATRRFEEPESKIASSLLPPRWKSFPERPRPFSVENKYNIEKRTEDEPSFRTTILFPRGRTLLRNANFKAPAFETLETSTNTAESKTPLNQNLDEEFDLATPSDHSPFRKVFKTSFFGDSSVKLPLKPSSDASSATEQKTNKSQLTENKTTRPLQKEEILEQLTENFGQPLYRGVIRRPFVFDLPQVQRSLDFETGLPIEESVRVTDESGKGNPVSSTTATTMQETTTTTESIKTTVETEFVRSLGFSLDINADREEYVRAILGGLIDEHTREDDDNESNVTQVTDKILKNETSTLEPKHKSSEDV